MSVGILVISHNQVGQTMYDAVHSMMGDCPLKTQILSVPLSCNPDDIITSANIEIETLNDGDGVLILTDMFGSTPSNIACALESDNVKIITGINLPMLVRVMNYPDLPLQQIANKAISGGQEGIMQCQKKEKSLCWSRK